jgi:hypothetical protein
VELEPAGVSAAQAFSCNHCGLQRCAVGERIGQFMALQAR